MIIAALGGRECTAAGTQFSDYENAAGTGQVHVWFERPPGGWCDNGRDSALRSAEGGASTISTAGGKPPARA